MWAIDAKYIDQLRKRVPEMPVGLFRSAVAGFVKNSATPPPNKLRDELEGMICHVWGRLGAKRAGEGLAGALGGCSDAARDLLDETVTGADSRALCGDEPDETRQAGHVRRVGDGETITEQPVE